MEMLLKLMEPCETRGRRRTLKKKSADAKQSGVLLLSGVLPLTKGATPRVGRVTAAPNTLPLTLPWPVKHKLSEIKMALRLDSRCVTAPATWVLGPKHVSNPAQRGLNPPSASCFFFFRRRMPSATRLCKSYSV